MNIDPAWLALIGTLCGGVGLRVAEHYLGRSRVRVDDATKIRDELRLQITSQASEIRDLETAVDKWRQEYYDLRETSMRKEIELMRQLDELKREVLGQRPNIPEQPK